MRGGVSDIYCWIRGPSGVAAAMAFINNGIAVTMLDYGNILNTESQLIVSMLSSKNKNEWNGLEEKIKFITNDNFPQKLIFADDFPYRDANKLINISYKNCGLQPSLALGGFSNVWGAGVFPFLDEDIKSWPISIKDLEPYYAKIHEFMPVAAVEDELSLKYPIYGKYIKFRNILKRLGMRLYVPISYKLVCIALSFFDSLGINLKPGKDSLISLVNQNTNPRINQLVSKFFTEDIGK